MSVINPDGPATSVVSGELEAVQFGTHVVPGLPMRTLIDLHIYVRGQEDTQYMCSHNFPMFWEGEEAAPLQIVVNVCSSIRDNHPVYVALELHKDSYVLVQKATFSNSPYIPIPVTP